MFPSNAMAVCKQLVYIDQAMFYSDAMEFYIQKTYTFLCTEQTLLRNDKLYARNYYVNLAYLLLNIYSFKCALLF